MKETKTVTTRRHRLGAGVLVVGMVLASVVVTASPAGSATFTTPTYFCQIGKPGKAFVYAWGMATASNGEILVSDYNNYNVKRFTPEGSYLGAFSSVGSGQGQNGQPYGLAVDPRNGNIYLADPIQYQLEVFRPDGSYLRTIQHAVQPSYAPRVAVNSQGLVYVVNSHNTDPNFPHRVLVYNELGVLLFVFGANGTGDGQFNVIRGIGIDASDNVYLVDSGNRRVQVFDSLGNFKSKFGSGGKNPGQFGYDMRGLSVDKDDGWLYVTDASEGQIEKFSTAGTHLATIGVPGSEPGQLGGARETTVGPDNNLYVADYAYWRINVYDPVSGAFLRDIPNPAISPPAGGFNAAEDVAVNQANGTVYVSDTFNHRIQKFGAVTVTPSGTCGGRGFQKMWGFRGRGDPNAMDYPRGIAVDPASPNNVWLNNTRSGNIKAYTADGAFIRQFGSQGSADDRFFYARGIWVGTDGRLLIPDSFNLRLKITDQLGNVQRIVSCGIFNAQNTLLTGCSGVTQDAVGNIYAAAPGENFIYKWNSNGDLITKFGGVPNSLPGQLNQPYDVAVSGTRLYVSEVGNNRISVFDLNGGFIGLWGGLGPAHGKFNKPMGLSVDAAGRIYVMDQGNNRVEVFVP